MKHNSHHTVVPLPKQTSATVWIGRPTSLGAQYSPRWCLRCLENWDHDNLLLVHVRLTRSIQVSAKRWASVTRQQSSARWLREQPYSNLELRMLSHWKLLQLTMAGHSIWFNQNQTYPSLKHFFIKKNTKIQPTFETGKKVKAQHLHSATSHARQPQHRFASHMQLWSAV